MTARSIATTNASVALGSVALLAAGTVVCCSCGNDWSPKSGSGVQPVPFDSLFGTVEDIRLEQGSTPIGLIVDIVAVDSALVIVDRLTADVRLYDRRGHLLGTIGSGNDPGQFRRPLRAVVLPGGRFAVLDNGRRMVSLWSTGGVFQSEWSYARDAFDMAYLQDGGHIALSGYASPGSAEDRQLRVHEYDLRGTYLRSFGRFANATKPWEQSFSGVMVGVLGDLVISAAYSSNRVNLYDLQTHRESWASLGGPWYKPLQWPDERPTSGVSGTQQVEAWVRTQVVLNRLVPVDTRRYLGRFQAYDSTHRKVYSYVLADTSGSTLAITDNSPVEIFRTSGSGIYGTVRDDSGVVSVRVLKLREATRGSGH